MLSTFHIVILCYCWVLLLVYLWARKHDPELRLVPSLLVAAIVSVIAYLPLILTGAVNWYLA